jgi:hypothetical protein
LGSDASATPFGFYCISNNNVTDCATGAAQLSVDVIASGADVAFVFTNSGPNASSITATYWDDGSLLAIGSITNGAGVAFSTGCTPGNLPAGNTASPAFVTSSGFCADSDPPTQPKGVNPGETLTVVYTLLGGQTLADVLTELGNGTVRIGIHVQGYTGGGSESLVNVVPEPGTFALLTLGFAGLATVGRRRSA